MATVSRISPILVPSKDLTRCPFLLSRNGVGMCLLKDHLSGPKPLENRPSARGTPCPLRNARPHHAGAETA